VVALFSWVVPHVPIKLRYSYINQKHKHKSHCPEKPFLSNRVKQLSIIYPKDLLNKAIPRIMGKNLGKSLKRYSYQV
jgi:hypothetical protein